MLVNFESKMVFIHIPKTAGSTINSTLVDWEGIWGFSNSHSTIDQIKENLGNTEGFRFVAFVRDPYARFQSMYNFLLIHGKIHDTPMTFANNIFTGRYNWSFTNPMCYFCRISDLWDIGRVENFNQDFQRIFNRSADNIACINKTKRPDIYQQFPQLRQMVTRLYYEDFVEFKYPMDPFIYKQIQVTWSRDDLKTKERPICQIKEHELTGSIFDKVPLLKN
jgi:hypothetical protein